MATLAPQSPQYTHWSQPQPKGALDHIPGEDGWPVLGSTLTLLADPIGFGDRMRAKYGDVFRNHAFGRRSVMLFGADANELVLFDRDKNFSSAQGWGSVLDLLFPRGLMLLDFDHHRADRRALSIAFKPGPMRHYADALNRGISDRVAQWSGREMQFYPAIKQLTLDLAADSFLGVPLGAEADAINKAFVDMVAASVGVVRKPMPFTAMGRGVAGRKFLLDYFTKETLKRRETGGGQDMFSQFATATHEDGSLMPVDEVVDHMIFLMMAAHDTTTSTLTTLFYCLARDPAWQDRLRADAQALPNDQLQYADLPGCERTEWAMKEALRLYPPLTSIPRKAAKDCSFGGFQIPKGTPVGISPIHTHHMPSIWTDPHRFDPERFSPARAEHKQHPYAYLPFGGGAHLCIGQHFADMEVKSVLHQVLRQFRFSVPEGYRMPYQLVPIAKPKDGLPITLQRL